MTDGLQAWRIERVIFGRNCTTLMCRDDDGKAHAEDVTDDWIDKNTPKRGEMLIKKPGSEPINVPEQVYRTFQDNKVQPKVTPERTSEQVVNTMLDVIDKLGIESQVVCAGPKLKSELSILLQKKAGNWKVRVTYPYTPDEFKKMPVDQWEMCINDLRGGLSLLTIEPEYYPGGRPIIEAD